MTEQDLASAGAQWRATAIIITALVIQLVAPLRYYFSADPFDERFSWRMFSGIRVTQCKAAALEEQADGRFSSIPLSGSSNGPYGTIHPAWEQLLKRGRPAVIDKFLRHRCLVSDAPRVVLINRCTPPASAETEQPSVDLKWSRDCQSGTTTEPTADSLRMARGLLEEN